MPHRYYCSPLHSGEFPLSVAEAQHAVKVMRNRVGDEIELFDGRGKLASAVITGIERRQVTVRTIEIQQSDRSSAPDIVVAAAAPRGDRMKWMVEKLTELGVAECIPLETERSVTDPGEGKLSKLESTVINACKQCRRLQAMEIGQPTSLTAMLSHQELTFWLAHPGAADPAMASIPDSSARHCILIGPEGGFTDDEIALILARGANLVSWPETILRIETAAVMAAVTVRNRLGNARLS